MFGQVLFVVGWVEFGFHKIVDRRRHRPGGGYGCRQFLRE